MEAAIDLQQPLVIKDPTGTDDIQIKMFDFQTAKLHLKRIIDDWKDEVEATDKRRKTRDVDIKVEDLRKTGQLDEDETIIPVRVIDTNITREQPPFVNYLKNSRRIAIFRSEDTPNTDTDNLEQEFTRVATYNGWETPHYRTLDGAQTHGFDAIEVVYDESKPGRFALEQVAHDNLFFAKSTIDIQYCPRVVRRYSVTVTQLRVWVKKFGFDIEQVNKLIAQRKDNSKENDSFFIYKAFLKADDGTVYCSWFHDTLCDDWLKKPVQHFVGILDKNTGKEAPIKMYPIFLLYYRETEKPYVTDHKGRVFLDEAKQEAQTAVLSGYVNGLTRASQIYASMAQEDGSGSSIKELTQKMVPGRILNRPVNFFSTPYPDPATLRALQYFDTANAQETNQVNFAAMNREDSRKTAQEIKVASQQQQTLNSVQLTLFSTFIRSVYSFCWLIVQSQAMRGNIKFLIVEKDQPRMNPLISDQPLTGPDGQPMMDKVFVNDITTIGQNYDVRAAGDVDVVQRYELIQQMQQDWNFISTTPLKDTFMIDYIKLKYPQSADRYSQILMSQGGQMQQMKGMIGQLSTILEGALQQNPEMMKSLPAQQQSDLATLMQQAKSVNGEQPSE